MAELGVIAAGDPQTAQAGADILRCGGNAVDAVVAAAFAAFFSELPLASPAGAGAAIWGREGQYELVDFFTRMPGRGSKSKRPNELDFFPVSVDFGPTTQEFHVGRGAASVPVALDGLLQLHKRGGSLPLKEVLAPAISLGRDGTEISSAVSWIIRLLEPIMVHTKGIADLACIDGSLVQAGQRVYNSALADLLETLGRLDPLVVLRDVRQAYLAEFGRAAGGLLTEADFDDQLVTVRAPLAVQVGNARVLTNPPPSSGGPLIGLGLRLAEALNLAANPFQSRAHIQGLCRVLGGVSAARQQGLGAILEDPSRCGSFLDDTSRWLASDVSDEPENILGSTTHISVLDGNGGAASLTMSNGEGCGHVLPGFGIHMNNFLGEEDINPLGFHQLAPGALMTTMMAPTIVTTDGEPRLVLGSGGSNRIRSVILQVLLNRLHFGQSIQDSVDAARCHIEGTRLWFEAEGLTADIINELQGARDDAAMFENAHMYFGGVHTVGLEADGFTGVGDHRRDGVALVVTK